MIRKQMIAMGGGGFSMEPENPLLDQYIASQARKDNPSVCFFPHATDDAVRYCFNFYKAFSRLKVKCNSLSLFTPPTGDLESLILEQDVIYVGGGNTKSMLALWREWDLDKILFKAYQQGVVLAGLSAGANCWFKEFSTDSIPGKLNTMLGLGLIEASFCPHYDSDINRRPSLHQLIGKGEMIPGYAADDGAAAHFVDGRLFQAVSSRPAAKVYYIENTQDGVSERVIATQYLSSQAF